MEKAGTLFLERTEIIELQIPQEKPQLLNNWHMINDSNQKQMKYKMTKL